MTRYAPWVACLVVIASGCHERRRADPGPAAGWHRVVRGETLLGIALRYHVRLADLVALNEIADADVIAEGSILFLPNTKPASRALAARPPAALRAARTLTGRAPAVAGRADPLDPYAPAAALEWPVDAEISSGFGPRDGRPHQGIDLRVPDGTPVRAAADGEVLYAGDGLRGYGRLVVLSHEGGLVTVYAHNSELHVRQGGRVVRGEIISRSGHTGRVTAPHLHFEVRQDGTPRDPGPYLRAAGRPR